MLNIAMATSTMKQKLAFKELIEAVESGQPFDMKGIMLKAGYTLSTAKNPELNLVSKSGWKELLAKIDDGLLLNELYELALDKQDKRAKLTAIQEIMKLKDRYPAGKLKVSQYEDSLKDLE